MTTEIFMVCGEAAVHVMVPPGEYIIGRSEDADIRIPEGSVSGRHARLVVDHESVRIQDLDSGNGTFVEGEPAVALTNLYDGQSAQLGAVALRVRQSTDPHSLGEGPRYVRGGMVAVGGMGAIHEARQSAMGRKVAMKVMLHSWNAASVKRFLDEARITGMLEHPNIVPVHEMGVDDEEQFFYTMKFVRGSTLAEVIAGLIVGKKESVDKFPLSALLTIFQKVCDAVAFAHSRGVWHRDLKPENIMIGDFGEVLVMDWGLAKEAGFAAPEPGADGGEVSPGEADSSGLAALRTMEGTVLGTPTYMSPEQARGETSAVDERSDVYALGAILHEILYLEPSVRGSSRDEVLEKVATGQRDAPQKPPGRHLPGQRVPASLEAVCRKAMALDPERRYPQVTNLQADISAYQSGFATSAEGAGLGKQLLLLVKRNRGVSVAVAAGLATLLVSSLLFTVNLVSARNRAQEASREATDKQKIAEEALARALDSEGKASAAGLIAEQAKTGEQTARAQAEAATVSSEEHRKMMEETRRNLSEDADRFARMARDAVTQARPNDAEQLIAAAVEYVPGNASYLRDHGLTLLALGKYDDAAARLERALALDPEIGAKKELAKAREMQSAAANGRQPSAESVTSLEQFLIAQGHGAYVRLMDSLAAGRQDTVSSQNAAGKDLSGAELIRERLSALTRQPSWKEERIKKLESGRYAVDLSKMDLKAVPDLAGADIEALDLEGTEIADITPLRGLSLRTLHLTDTKVSDLSPLRNMIGLRNLRTSAGVSDLSPLKGLRLNSLDVSRSQVKDLEPVRNAKLIKLRIAGCEIANLEPVSTQPIEELDARVKVALDLAPLTALSALKNLSLPPGTGPIDARAMPDLQEILIPDVRPDAPISGDEYRQLDALRREAWKKHGPELSRLKDVTESDLIVRQGEGGFDLDLRGTGIPDLAPIVRLPFHRLFIDTADKPIDVDLLGSHPTLRHLSLENAWVDSVEGLARNRKLTSLVLSRDTADTSALAEHPGLQALGYKLGPDGLSPPGTAAEFFGPRLPDEKTDPASNLKPKHHSGFDSAADGAAGWKVQGAEEPDSGALWTADPKAEGGAGGGFLSFSERSVNKREVHFVSPPSLRGIGRSQLYYGLLEFRLRVGKEPKEEIPVQVTIVGADKQLVHIFKVRPREKWRTFFVRLMVDSNIEWRLNRADGAIASWVDLSDALGKLREIRIRADYGGSAAVERTDLDDVRLWDGKGPEAGTRISQLERAAR